MNTRRKKTKSDELRFQVRLAQIQLRTGAVLTIAVAAASASLGIIAGVGVVASTIPVEENALMSQDLIEWIVIASGLFIGGMALLIATLRKSKKRLASLYKEAEDFDQDVQSKNEGEQNADS